MLEPILVVKDQALGPREDSPHLEPSLRRKAAMLASVLALIALIVGSLFGDRGMIRLVEQRQRAEALQRRIDDLRAENHRLAEEVRGLKSDPRAVERLAREQLGLARPGETVYLLREVGGKQVPDLKISL